MNPTQAPNRCRLVLIAPPSSSPERVLSALAGGDVASLILPQGEIDDATFQSFAEKIVPAAQQEGVAVILAGEPRIAARVHADGIHVEGSKDTIGDLIEKHQSKMMVGSGGVTTRDDALELGELQPDYIFFGRFNYDNKPEPHPRNLKLGGWWSEMVEVPCIVLAGSAIESVVDVAAAGVDFVAVSAAVYGDGIDPAAAVARANALLEEQAPQFES